MQIPEELLFLLPVIVGVTEWLKRMVPALEDDKYKWVSKLVSMSLSIGGAFVVLRPDADWRTIIIAGVVLGLSVSGLYEYAKPVGRKLKPLT